MGIDWSHDVPIATSYSPRACRPELVREGDAPRSARHRRHRGAAGDERQRCEDGWVQRRLLRGCAAHQRTHRRDLGEAHEVALGLVRLRLAMFGSTVDNGVVLATVTDAEKQHLVVDGAAVTHSDFGFTVPLPSTDFEFNADLQKQANQEFEQRGIGSANYAWVLSNQSRGEAIIVIVTKGVGNSEAAFGHDHDD